MVWLDEAANGNTTVALLNFLTEKRDQILLIVSCGGTCFFFFFGFADGGGGFCGRALSESLESEDIFACGQDSRNNSVELTDSNEAQFEGFKT